MPKPESGPNRRLILAVALATVGVPAAVVGPGIGSFGASSVPSARSAPAVTPAAPAAAAAAVPPVPSPAAAPVTTLPWADEAAPPPAPTPTPEAAAAPVEAAARPVHVSLGRLGIASDLMTLGLNPDGTVEVPPSARRAPAGWYDGSARPGEVGAAVILGHVDSVYGPGVFHRLRETRPGDRILVRRDDGSATAFTVDRVRTYPRPEFPTGDVYGPLDHAGLRLITCAGPYDRANGGYQANVVVFASATPTG